MSLRHAIIFTLAVYGRHQTVKQLYIAMQGQMAFYYPPPGSRRRPEEFFRAKLCARLRDMLRDGVVQADPASLAFWERAYWLVPHHLNKQLLGY